MREELHKLINTLEVDELKRQLHALADELDDETASKTVSRMSERRDALERGGWAF